MKISNVQAIQMKNEIFVEIVVSTLVGLASGVLVGIFLI
jgi:hypothetical protein